MGLRGSSRQKRPWCIPGSPDFNELMFGPQGTKTEAEHSATFPRIRRRWRNGGREAVMGSREFIGWRPLGFWLCEISSADLRLINKQCNIEAEAVLKLKLADSDERQAIADRGVIAAQLRELAADMKAHPDDYR